MILAEAFTQRIFYKSIYAKRRSTIRQERLRTQRKQQTDSRLSCGKKGRTISSVFDFSKLSYASFERNSEELLCFNRELHREFVDDFLGVTTNDEIDSVFHRNTALLTVEKLIF